MEFNKTNTKKLTQIILVSILFYFTISRIDIVIGVVKYIWELLFVFIMGAAMAFIFNVPMKGIENKLFNKNEKLKKLKRPIAYLITLALMVIAIFTVLFIVVPELANTINILSVQVQNFYQKLPIYIENISKFLPEFEEYVMTLNIDWGKISQDAILTVQAAFSGLINSGGALVVGVLGGVTTFIMSFIFSIYILMSKEKLIGTFKKLFHIFLTKKQAERTIYIFTLSNKIFSSFLSGQCLEAVILGVMFFIAMTIFKMPYAVLMGVVIAVTALIPVFGAFIGCILGAFLIVMVNPMQALWFVLLFLVLQQIEGNVIYPRVVGNSIGLPPILVFIAVIVGGNLMGIMGMLIFIPLCSIFYTLIKELVDKKSTQQSMDNTLGENLL